MKKQLASGPHTKPNFAGYTLDELRYQRALIALKREFCKESIIETADKLHKMSPFSSEGQKGMTKHIGSLPGKILTGLSYFDYATLGFTAFNTIRKIYSLFHHKKRK